MSSTSGSDAPRLGPNAVLQTLGATRRRHGPGAASGLLEQAGLQDPDQWAPGLIPEAWFLAVLDAVRSRFPPEEAEQILAEAGRATAAYVTENRLPRIFRGLLRILPARLALPLLLTAFARHAWTFAGAGRFSTEGAYPGFIVLENAPTCRAADPTGPRRGSFYAAAFEGLLDAAAPGIRVREVECTAQGAPACRFRLAVEPLAPPRSGSQAW